MQEHQWAQEPEAARTSERAPVGQQGSSATQLVSVAPHPSRAKIVLANS